MTPTVCLCLCVRACVPASIREPCVCRSCRSAAYLCFNCCIIISPPSSIHSSSIFTSSPPSHLPTRSITVCFFYSNSAHPHTHSQHSAAFFLLLLIRWPRVSSANIKLWLSSAFNMRRAFSKKCWLTNSDDVLCFITQHFRCCWRSSFLINRGIWIRVTWGAGYISPLSFIYWYRSQKNTRHHGTKWDTIDSCCVSSKSHGCGRLRT